MGFDFMDDEDEKKKHLHDIIEEATGLEVHKVGMDFIYHSDHDLEYLRAIGHQYQRQKFADLRLVPEKKIRILTMGMLDRFLKLILPSSFPARKRKKPKPRPVLTMGPTGRPRATVEGKFIDLEKLKKRRDRLRRRIAKMELRQNDAK